MRSALLAQVRSLLDRAASAYHDDSVATARLERDARRLDGPLRVAVAGMVKAGKSTLLNAIIGEEIAPTDAGECTKVIIWYRHGRTPRITMHLRSGDRRDLPVRRVGGRLAIDLAPNAPEDVDRIVVEWPARRLEDVSLIDTPGMASLSTEISARSRAFLTPEATPSEADAILYLTRHMHAADLGFLAAFHDTAIAPSRTVNAICVLSRADEIGAGRIDALLSARSIAERYRGDGSLRSLVLDVVPIAGLVAQAARTLREEEFDALRRLARLGRDARERMLMSVDRFVRADAPSDLDPEERRNLLERFGMFGIRLAAVSIRAGCDDSTELAEVLYRRSGMHELVGLMSDQFRSRADVLKTRTALASLGALLRDRPRPETAEVARELERLETNAHGLRELELVSSARTSGIRLPAAETAEAERLVGGSGAAVPHRLGLPDDTSPEELRRVAAETLSRWRARASGPLLEPTAVEACEVVVRSCEALVVATAPDSVGTRRLRLVPQPEPAVRGPEQLQDPAAAGQQKARNEQRLDEDAEL